MRKTWEMKKRSYAPTFSKITYPMCVCFFLFFFISFHPTSVCAVERKKKSKKKQKTKKSQHKDDRRQQKQTEKKKKERKQIKRVETFKYKMSTKHQKSFAETNRRESKQKKREENAHMHNSQKGQEKTVHGRQRKKKDSSHTYTRIQCVSSKRSSEAVADSTVLFMRERESVPLFICSVVEGTYTNGFLSPFFSLLFFF